MTPGPRKQGTAFGEPKQRLDFQDELDDGRGQRTHTLRSLPMLFFALSW